ncbi:MAG: hypothetical protein AB7V16_07395 [Vulcanibacillus sp.]
MKYLNTYDIGESGENLKDDQLANFWLMSFSDQALPSFDLYVESHNLPLYSIKTERLPELSLVIPGGMSDYRTYSITYRETVDFQGMKYHKEWLDQLYDFEKRLVKKTFHTAKRNAIIKFISPYSEDSSAGGPLQNAEFTLINMQFVGFEDVQLSNTEGDALTITCQYEVENILANFDRKRI